MNETIMAHNINKISNLIGEQHQQLVSKLNKIQQLGNEAKIIKKNKFQNSLFQILQHLSTQYSQIHQAIQKVDEQVEKVQSYVCLKKQLDFYKDECNKLQQKIAAQKQIIKNVKNIKSNTKILNINNSKQLLVLKIQKSQHKKNTSAYTTNLQSLSNSGCFRQIQQKFNTAYTKPSTSGYRSRAKSLRFI